MNDFSDRNMRFKMLAFGGRSRSRSLGGLDPFLMPDPNVSGFKDSDSDHKAQINLNQSPFEWQSQHVYHDAQFRSYLARVRNYWTQFLRNLRIACR